MTAAQVLHPFNPTVALSLGVRRQAGGTGLDAQVGIQQQVEVAGQRKRRRERARVFRELSLIGIDAAAWQVHADVHGAFRRALLAEERASLAEERTAIAEGLLRIAERRVEVGDESPLVLEVVKAELALAETAETAAHASVATSRLMLAQACGSLEPAMLQPLGSLEQPSPTPGGPALARAATETNPVLRQADAATRVAQADLALARKQAWPSPTVGLNYAREGATTTPGNFSPSSTIWMGTLQIPIPAFARNQGPVARSRAEVRIAQTRAQATLIEFTAMVSVAAVRVDAAARRANDLEQGVVTAFERSHTGLRRAYELGELGFLDVTQGLERLWAARFGALEARVEFYNASEELERLVGPLESSERHTRSDLDELAPEGQR